MLFWTIFGKLPEVFEYQVQQTQHGVNILIRSTKPIQLDETQQEIISGLSLLGLSDPEVVVNEVDYIERHRETGKLRRFVPLST